MLVNQKITHFRHTGADLTLSVGAAPWLSNVLKIIGLTVPVSGLNTRQTYNGTYDGSNGGGSLTKLINGNDYELISAIYNGWTLPTSIEVVSLLNQAPAALPIPEPLLITSIDAVNGTATIAPMSGVTLSQLEIGTLQYT